ncbi:MAG: hemolysin family protein [Planctomycetaceae bacterium]
MTFSWWTALATVGLLLSSVGGLGSELLDRFAGRTLEAYSRLRHNRERFGAVLDGQDAALTASKYLRVIGTVIFLVCGTVALSIADREPQPARLAIWAVCAAALLMLIHLWLPSALTRFASAPVLYHTWPFWKLLSITMAPLSAPGELLAIMTRRLTGNPPDEDEDEVQLEDDIRTMVTAGTREGYFGPAIRDMIQGVMELKEDTVAHIMTPRSDVEAISSDADWPEILQAVIDSGRTRLPVYEHTLDKIVGVLYVKDLLPLLCAGTLETVSPISLMRKPWTVSIDQSVETLLREFLHSRSHLAIVLDEFQQTAGVVTIEDALEEIVGEIVDESDEEEQSGLVVIDPETAQADGRVMIDDLNEELGWQLPESDDYETVAGYVLHHTGSIPEDGQRIIIGEVEFEIVRATNRQIESVRLHHLGNKHERETA